MLQHAKDFADCLGTTTPAGFKGYFEPLRREPGMQMYLIKSGPGCGKSTLMKRLAVKAEQKGEPIQRIHCASDPDSLDGVIFLDKRAAIVDATAPHVMEPDAPGAEEQVVSLYHTLDADALHAHADEVKRLFAQNASLPCRDQAARLYRASAGSSLLDSRRAEACSANFEKVRRYVKRLCARTLPRLPEGASASEELRLLSAITPKGPVFYRGTVQALADRYVVFHDDYGAVSRLLLELIRAEALARGYHIITCPCAMHPDDKIDHLFIPALRLAFLTDNRWAPRYSCPAQAVRCTRLYQTGKIGKATAPSPLQRAGGSRAFGTGRRPDGTGQSLPRRAGDLLPRRRGLRQGGRSCRPVRRDAGAGVGVNLSGTSCHCPGCGGQRQLDKFALSRSCRPLCARPALLRHSPSVQPGAARFAGRLPYLRGAKFARSRLRGCTKTGPANYKYKKSKRK